MCERCDMIEVEKERLTKIALNNPIPCLVCADPDVVAVGTWIPGDKQRLAAGGKGHTPVFAFWLCPLHATINPINEKLIQQSVLRDVRTGKKFKPKGE